MHAVWERIPKDLKTWSPALDFFEKGERKPETGVKEEEYFRSEVV
jgi:hypothetical protein